MDKKNGKYKSLKIIPNKNSSPIQTNGEEFSNGKYDLNAYIESNTNEFVPNWLKNVNDLNENNICSLQTNELTKYATIDSSMDEFICSNKLFRPLINTNDTNVPNQVNKEHDPVNYIENPFGNSPVLANSPFIQKDFKDLPSYLIVPSKTAESNGKVKIIKNIYKGTIIRKPPTLIEAIKMSKIRIETPIPSKSEAISPKNNINYKNTNKSPSSGKMDLKKNFDHQTKHPMNKQPNLNKH